MGILENGETVDKAVQWNIDNVDVNNAGVYTAVGTLAESDVTINATISVYKQVGAAENYSSVYHEGSLLELPSETVVYYKNGDTAGTFPIQWKYYDETEFTKVFKEYGVENIIRVGSAGALSENVNIRDIVLGMAACTNSNFAQQFDLPGTFAPICSYTLLEKVEWLVGEFFR